MTDRKPWVGDQVYDEVTDRPAIVTDVRRGSRYILRPVLGGGRPWVAEDPKKLLLMEPRPEPRR